MKRLLSICALLMPATIVSGLDDMFILVSRDASARPISLAIIGPREVEVMDTKTGFATLDRETCIAFMSPSTAPGTGRFSSLALRDGQVFPGRRVDVDDPGFLTWDHPWLGHMRMPTERVDRITLVPGTNIVPTTDVDRIQLRNGDVLTGFITSINDPILVELEQGDAGDITSVPWDRVAAIDLFDDPVPPTDPRVWFIDGTVASFPSISLGADTYLRLPPHPLQVPGTVVSAVDPNLKKVHTISLGGAKIISLAALPVISTSVPETRLQEQAPAVMDSRAPLGLSPIDFHGPLTVQYRLPPGLLRFRSTAMIPTGSRTWGDFELIVSVDGRELDRVYFSSDEPEHDLDMEVEGSVLQFQLLEGANGPVQDHLRLEYPIFMEPGNEG